MATVCETERLRLRHLSGADAAFMLKLLNDPDYIRNIADRGVRTVEDAERYIVAGPAASYEKYGFGLYLVELKESSRAVGLCGLLRRDYHPDVEIGYAFLPVGRGQGYVMESATAVLGVARKLGVERLVAVTAPDNVASVRVLEKLGFRFEGIVNLPGHVGMSRFFVREDLQGRC